MSIIVQTEQLTKTFQKQQAVDHVDMVIREGEIYGFLGPNGAGKTTTIRMLLGLMKPTSGTVRIFGKELQKHKLDILRQVGSLVENPSYYPHLTAYENLNVVREIVGVPHKRISEVLETVRLTEAAHRKVKGFSLGMKQRLGIAAALLHQPKLLVLDEPTNGLDPSGIIEIRELIKSLPQQYGMTVLISSHLLSEIDQIATAVGVVSRGKLIYQDQMSNLRKLARSTIRIQCSEPGKAVAALKQLELAAAHEQEQLILENCSNRSVADAVSLLVHQGHDIYRVEENKQSLEQIFLSMTDGVSL
ncbi:ABC transporter ATP-binding protein [Paenibacillus camelliae]|uniref:ABC transporter ATP-binding protein n=1 Tax=Paenibacillus camelliae TaxID=512410 RepID=UPI002040A38B|nr:ABC transporter ATP-binding protein [Paenibacillus camelliae]MCM3634778.1 ABC transporter ATP-binding protein [Paenibacillus camelliae]